MVDHVFRLHGLPVSDRGPQFASRFWKEFCRQIGALASLSSGLHPQTNGQCERANQDLERMLRCLTSNNPSSWCQQLSWIEYARNSLPVAASGMSPFECSVGYKPPLFPSQEPDAAVPSALAFVQRCRHTWERVREILLRSAGRTKAAADHRRSSPPTYVCGQQIWLSTKDLPSRKLAPRFIGPYRVAKVVNPVAIRLKLPPTLGRVHPVFHVSKVKPVFSSPLNPAAMFLCFSAPPSVRPDTVGFHPDTCRSGLSADSLWMAQPLARICEQPRQLHCFCRCYGSSRRGDRTICVAEDSALLWLPVEALFTCLLFAVQINLRCTRIWILPLLPDIIQCCHMKIYNKICKKCEGCTNFCEILYNCLVWFSYQNRHQKTTTDSRDCWEDHWCSSAQPSRTLHLQSEEKG